MTGVQTCALPICNNVTTANNLVSPTTTTTYTVTVTAANGCTASDAVVVFLGQAAAITSAVVSGTYSVCLGTALNATLTCNATGSNLQYQWYTTLSNGTTTAVPNGNQSVLSNVSTPGVYYCKVTGICNTVNSELLTLSLYPYAIIVGNCLNQQMEIVAYGLPIGYQWFKKGYNSCYTSSSNNIPSATSVFHTPTTIGGYFAEVYYNGCYAVTPLSCVRVCTTAPTSTSNKTTNQILAEAYWSIDWKTYNVKSTATTNTTEASGSKELGLQVSPNPLTDHGTITFSIPKAGNVKISLSDASGMKKYVILDAPYEEGEHQTELELGMSHLSKGIYFVTLQFEDKIKTQKVVVMD